MNSVMTHQFAKVPQAEIQRSSFDRSHGYKTTFNAGKLVPIFVDEALPGDTFNMRMNAFARISTPIKPVMDNMFLDSFFFAVPMRLVWQNWEKFNGQQDSPGDSTDYVIPQIAAPGGGFQVGSVGDYFGLPTGVDGLSVSALPFRAYNLIWNEWFRDQNLCTPRRLDKGDGPDDYTYYGPIAIRGKRHDYFTSCLPWPQKGPEVLLPLGNTAPVVTNDAQIRMTSSETANTGLITLSGTDNVGLASGQSTSSALRFGDQTGLVVSLSAATSATINSLREAFQIQRLYERDARGGTRYTEIIRAHFNVVSPDARLQRPEYLGGGSSPITFHPIAQSSGSAGAGGYTDTPQGNLASFGTVGVSGHGFSKSFTEHCLIIGMVCVRADLNYQQGINRMWSRKNRFDFYWPALAHLGEQAVLNKEIYAQGLPVDNEVFGYQERFAEYRYKPSLITGEFRSSDPQSLDYWHLAQDFANLPTLSSVFIQEDPPVDRIVAVPSEPHFLFDSFFNLKCARPMPVYGVPGMIDHF